MSYSNQPIHTRLDAAAAAIRGALRNPEVLALLAARSYDKKAIKDGEALYERARALSGRIQRTRGGQYDCTDDIGALWKKLQKMYRLDLILARTEFDGSRGSRAKLGLSGQRERSLKAWIVQVRGFYDTLAADEALAERLAPLGLTREVLQERQAALAALEAARLAQADARGDAQELTRKRRAAVAELDAWMRRYLRIARVALDEQPQLLEKLGITARA